MPLVTERIELGGDGEAEGMVVLLHGLDHSPEPMKPVVRALEELRRFMAAQGATPPRLRVLAPYRGAPDRPGFDERRATLESLVEAYYAPLAPGGAGVPVVTIGESLGAALSDVWSWREPGIAHQIWLDPLPARLALIAFDRALVAAAMLAQFASFRLRRLGLNLTGPLDRAMLREALDPRSRGDRERYLRQKMQAPHWRWALVEARLILRMALAGPSAPRPPPDRLTPVTTFLPPRGPSWLDRKVVGPAAHRIAVASFSGRKGARIAHAKAGTHYNLSEMAAPYVAWRALAGLGLSRCGAFFEEWPLAARFADHYWAAVAVSAASAPGTPELASHLAEG